MNPSAFSDPKQGEREYFARIGEEGRRHSLRKPFADDNCPRYLAHMTAFFALMRPPPARLVEFGCGTGWLSVIFAEYGYEVIGIDISPDAIALAEQTRQARGNLPHLQFRTADYEDVRIDPPADFVIFHDSLHHAESERAALQAAYDALAPGGMVICSEPGDGHSETAASRRAIEEFGVHEKDMPPRVIIHHARAVGFRRHVVLPWPWDYLRAMYRTGYAKATSSRDLRGRKLLSLVRLVRFLIRTRGQGLVVLWKD